MDKAVEARLEAMDLTAEKCGFSWYDVSKLEHQLVNIRYSKATSANSPSS